MATKALHFPGSALVYADRPANDTALDAPATGVLVIRFRIKFASGGGLWLAKELEPASTGYFFVWNGGSNPIQMWDGAGFISLTYSGAPALTNGAWYEAVTRIDQRSGVRIQDWWLNGNKGAGYTSATLVSVAATPLLLGHRIDGGGLVQRLRPGRGRLLERLHDRRPVRRLVRRRRRPRAATATPPVCRRTGRSTTCSTGATASAPGLAP
jgi:hypothetical protein